MENPTQRQAGLLGSLGYRFEDRAYNTHGKGSEKEAKGGGGELGLRAWSCASVVLGSPLVCVASL